MSATLLSPTFRRSIWSCSRISIIAEQRTCRTAPPSTKPAALARVPPSPSNLLIDEVAVLNSQIAAQRRLSSPALSFPLNLHVFHATALMCVAWGGRRLGHIRHSGCVRVGVPSLRWRWRECVGEAVAGTAGLPAAAPVREGGLHQEDRYGCGHEHNAHSSGPGEFVVTISCLFSQTLCPALQLLPVWCAQTYWWV
jgi:hypothetical protein